MKKTVDTIFCNDNGLLVMGELKTEDYRNYTIEASILYRDKPFTNTLLTFATDSRDKAILIFNRTFGDLI